jgi:hypothetical protein
LQEKRHPYCQAQDAAAWARLLPPAVVAAFHGRLQPPTSAEGFAALFRVLITPGAEFAAEPVGSGPVA